MRTLILMRHAEAEPSNMGGDKARHLSARGIVQAQQAGTVIDKYRVDYVLSSSSTRTRETFAHLGLSSDPTVEFLDELYLCSPSTFENVINTTPDKMETLLVLGHAPGIHALSAQLASDPDAHQLSSWFPTATISVFSVDCPWSELTAWADDDFHLVEVQRPRG